MGWGCNDGAEVCIAVNGKDDDGDGDDDDDDAGPPLVTPPTAAPASLQTPIVIVIHALMDPFYPVISSCSSAIAKGPVSQPRRP